jgi:hypothetical protein
MFIVASDSQVSGCSGASLPLALLGLIAASVGLGHAPQGYTLRTDLTECYKFQEPPIRTTLLVHQL